MSSTCSGTRASTSPTCSGTATYFYRIYLCAYVNVFACIIVHCIGLKPRGLGVTDSESDGESVGEWSGGVCVV